MSKTDKQNEKYDEATTIHYYLQDIQQSRYALGYYCTRQLQRDHLRFEQSYTDKFSNGFICRILTNYLSYAKDRFKKEFEDDVLEFMSGENQSFDPDEEKYTQSKVFPNNKLKKMMSLFLFSQKPVKNGRMFFKSSRFFSYILERFAKLPLAEREIIYCYEVYNVITANTYDKKRQTILRLRSIDGKLFELKPYICTMDDNTLSYYVIGYSRPYGSGKPFQCHSNCLSRLAECETTGEEFSLTGVEKRNIRRMYEKFGAAYIHPLLDPDNIRITEVILTQEGYYDFLKKYSYQRPIPIEKPRELKQSELSDEDRAFFGAKASAEEKAGSFFSLRFDCSHNQLRYYFRVFGNEVRIKFRYAYEQENRNS